jgi:NAD(P)-dependent dehydrogenase (short-subunit alcohol dehydrogenase family)
MRMNPHDFEGRVAIVTGGAGGIGGAVTRALLDGGATVLCADLTLPPSPDGWSGDARRFRPSVVDVTSRARVESLVREAETTLGRLDILVNVAGVRSTGAAAPLAEDEWDRVMSVNLKGTFLCCQAAMPVMRKGGYGRIVNIGSVVGKNSGNARPWVSTEEQARYSNAAYGISKAGVHALTGFLAKELGGSGITVNAVAPGPIATTMTAGLADELCARIPVGRMGTCADVARAVLFLASAEAGFITGEVLDVNGGMWCD